MALGSYLQELADVLMPQYFHGGNFKPDSWQVFAKLLFVHDLDGNLLAGQKVGRQLDFGEAAGADGLV